MRHKLLVLLLVIKLAGLACGQQLPRPGLWPNNGEVQDVASPRSSAGNDVHKAGYLLGPDDTIAVRVLELEDFSPDKLPPIRIDSRGTIHLPIIGRLDAAGRTDEQLEQDITVRLSRIMYRPEVTVTIVTFRNHPVSVLGSVRNPGVQQVIGPRTLFEVLSLAGGLSPDASNTIMITRLRETNVSQPPNALQDPTGKFLIGQVNVKSVMNAMNPLDNVEILANDIITVPKADLVYVIGAVKKAGGFVLNEKDNLSVLQALALAEGLDRAAGPKNARILRQEAPGNKRSELPVDVRSILAGRAPDPTLLPNDILFIPTNASRNAALRGLEAAIQLGTGVVIYRR